MSRIVIALTEPIRRIIRVRMADSARADPLHEAPILSPVQRPLAHVMVARRMDATRLTGAILWVM
jgi:hypothetical protein